MTESILTLPVGSLPSPGPSEDSGARVSSEAEWVSFPMGTVRDYGIWLRPLGNGRFLAFCDSLPGAIAEAGGAEAARDALEEVLRALLELYAAEGTGAPYLRVEREVDDQWLCAFRIEA